MPGPMPMLPGAGGPPGAAPPGFPPGAQPGGTGAAMAPQGMAGSKQGGMAAVHTAVKSLQESLPNIPMGSPLHTAVLKAITEISKHMEGAQPDQNAMVQQLVGMAKSAQQQPAAAAALHGPQMGGGGGGAPPM